MGFFSSRRSDEDHVPDEKHTVANVIRSRFYGKNKGKEREIQERPKTIFIPQDISTAQTLSHPTPAPSHSHSIRHAVSIPLLSSRKPSTPNTPHEGSHSSRTFSVRLKSSVRKGFLSTDPSASTSVAPRTSDALPPLPNRISESQETVDDRATTASIKSHRKKTDSVTATLAQRLNELAAANEQGLLNEEEYRVLRQNLFERFASNATVPTENPVVPATPIRNHLRGTAEGRASTSSRPSSNFFVEVPRSPSIRSKTSIRSGVASLFRAGGRRAASASNDFGDTMSVYSATSMTSQRLQPLRKKSSKSSVHTEPPRQSDTISIASRRTERIPIDYSSASRPHTPARSNASLRRMMDTPPSSFPRTPRTPVSEKYSGSVRDVFDDANLQTSRDIKQEIEAVEGERMRLLDAFNGLEVTTLAKRQRQPNAANSRPSTIVVDNLDHLRSGMKMGSSPSTLTPDSPSPSHLRVLAGEDALSIRSGASIGMNTSLGRSSTNSRKTSSKGGGSLHRKNSSGSASSGRPTILKAKYAVPPVPAIPSHLGSFVHGSNSSINLTRSTGHLPMSSLPEDGVEPDPVAMEEDDLEFEAEMDDIRRRREEVYRRYEARLEYLRAKLKGAQLHEKLMKK
ncbi:hypothetical protein V5O48_012260 [Marasmius crinis-equi]|uniref:Uncharacterized protein n=1 Tax=Marasmius crinis-equi TaxID=585013 RepID=A0ABR3F3C4_9AGAR